jgi:hypothetical protein
MDEIFCDYGEIGICSSLMIWAYAQLSSSIKQAQCPVYVRAASINLNT